MKDTTKKDITDEDKRQDEINPSPDANWAKSRAEWERSMNKQPGVREGHVVEYSGNCEIDSY